MRRPRLLPLTLALLQLAVLASCSGNQGGDQDEADIKATETPVTFTRISRGALSQLVTLNATSAFMKKNALKSSVNGYVVQADASPGQWVHAGQPLFVLRTREAAAIGAEARKLDSTLGFSGTITVRAPLAGFISELFHQTGDYVLDGESLCTIADKSSFVFLLDVPVELGGLVKLNTSCTVDLPDGNKITGEIVSMLPTVDSASQTQRYEIRPAGISNLPENLLAKVEIPRQETSRAIILPREAVLTDEGESSFWIMKLINDTTAVKVPVTVGMTTGDSIQIVSPPLSDSDRILLTGNYGLDDTATVRIQRK